ncbi:acyl-CoA dehydrogenase family protein [Noviherbaspirillum aerium]|uniref:acyl-CoA dehydrogenase family protein n=1 Tax=Noviherbaspirillum aerium TaxID=2588497 RepID=UPI00124D1A99|nr:acyl-CoA dehydrogenase family protein [Noviherbaspirillum aerium]
MSTYSFPWMTPDLELFRDNIRRFFDSEVIPHEDKWRAQHHPDRAIWRKAGEIGMLCASIPEQYGGGGGDFLHEAVICIEQNRALSNSFSLNVHSGILAHYILRYGTEEQKQRWLPKMASGEMVGAIAMTEPSAGSDLQSIKTTAVRDGGEYVINGGKTFITNGYHADLVCVAVKTDPQGKGRGVSLLMLETRDLKGFRRGRFLEKIGQRGQDTVELFFDDVRVPAENLLGQEEGRGFAQLMEQLPQERLLIAIGAVAVMQRAVQETTDYVRQREAFGKPLIAMQNTRFKLAECKTTATIAQTFVDQCVVQLMAGRLDVQTAAMAKWWTTQMNCQVIDECLQLHGGYGYMLEYPIARMYADSRVGKIYGGSNEIMKEVIARAIERE